MDSEEKELLKKLLKKVDKLEEELKERDMKIQNLREGTKSKPKFPPMPRTKDKLAQIIVSKARQRIEEQAAYEQTPQAEMRRKDLRVEDIRKNFSLGEVILFIVRKKIPVGNKEEKGSGESLVIKE